jgi:hypothetical protein
VPHAVFWSGLFLLGCYHGLNPGMGWLFAVALGLQERNRRTIFAALPPIALGHVASVLAIVALAGLAKTALPQAGVKYGAAAVLIAFGLYRALRARHLRWVGMRVGPWGLAAWAFLMASGHGAGLMLLPFLLPLHQRSLQIMPMPGMAASAPHLPLSLWLAAVGVHTLGYLATMTAAALVVYDRLGVRILRTAWFNFDLVWAAALIISGCILLFV